MSDDNGPILPRPRMYAPGREETEIVAARSVSPLPTASDIMPSRYSDSNLEMALTKAINYLGLDARLNREDWVLAAVLLQTPSMQDYIKNVLGAYDLQKARPPFSESAEERLADPESLDSQVFQALGAASVMWDESGVFRSEDAKKLGERLLSRIEEDYQNRVGAFQQKERITEPETARAERPRYEDYLEGFQEGYQQGFRNGVWRGDKR